MNTEDREALQRHYYHIVNLQVLGLKTMGQILERFRKLDEAMQAYVRAKDQVEANYGHSDKLYIELINLINGARLRTKYFQNSNLPGGGIRSAIQYENARRPPSAQPYNYSAYHQKLPGQSSVNLKPAI